MTTNTTPEFWRERRREFLELAARPMAAEVAINYNIRTEGGARTLRMYRIVSAMIDTYMEEWIVSAARLAPDTAADLIVAGRRLAWPPG